MEKNSLSCIRVLAWLVVHKIAVIDNSDDHCADVIVITTTMIHIPIISKFRVLTTVEWPANYNHNFIGICINLSTSTSVAAAIIIG